MGNGYAGFFTVSLFFFKTRCGFPLVSVFDSPGVTLAHTFAFFVPDKFFVSGIICTPAYQTIAHVCLRLELACIYLSATNISHISIYMVHLLELYM